MAAIASFAVGVALSLVLSGCGSSSSYNPDHPGHPDHPSHPSDPTDHLPEHLPLCTTEMLLDSALWLQEEEPLATTVPAPVFLAHCNSDEDDKHGWPRFESASELRHSQWAAYFERVYGEVPTVGYPICIDALKYLHGNVVVETKVSLPMEPVRCPKEDGELYNGGHGWDPLDALWIWHPNVASPTETGFVDNTWVEFTHRKDTMGGDATWMYYMPGTGIWFNVGKTKVFDEHDDAVRYFLKCNPEDWFWPTPECHNEWAALYNAARRAGYNSFQFRRHADQTCSGLQRVGRVTTALEIVDLGGNGLHVCGSDSYRSGWQASKPCACSETASEFANCEGVPLVASTPPAWPAAWRTHKNTTTAPVVV